MSKTLSLVQRSKILEIWSHLQTYDKKSNNRRPAMVIPCHKELQKELHLCAIHQAMYGLAQKSSDARPLGRNRML
jgi:hypothetical protein